MILLLDSSKSLLRTLQILRFSASASTSTTSTSTIKTNSNSTATNRSNPSPRLLSLTKSEEYEAARISVKNAISQRRPGFVAKSRANFSNFVALMKFRLFYDRSFRMREFRRAARNVSYEIAKCGMTKNDDGMKTFMTPEAIAALRKQINRSQSLLPSLWFALNPESVLREKLYSADFANTYLADGRARRTFEITWLCFCRIDQRVIDRQRPTIILKHNRFGGIDEVRGTISPNDYGHAALWITLSKSLDKEDERKDWAVTRYEPLLALIPWKNLKNYL